jgi:hypothetical protein
VVFLSITGAEMRGWFVVLSFIPPRSGFVFRYRRVVNSLQNHGRPCVRNRGCQTVGLLAVPSSKTYLVAEVSAGKLGGR